MPSFNVKSFTLDPAEILGKLHFAAETHVKDKFGKNIEVVNTLIDTTDPNKPKAVLKNGTYTLKITLNNDDFKNDKKKIIEPVVEYLTWFAGKDAAEQMQKRGGNMFQRFLMKLEAYKSKRSDIEKSKTVDKNNNTTTFTFDYSVTIHQGSQQNESIVNSHEKFNLCLEFDFIDVPLVF